MRIAIILLAIVLVGCAQGVIIREEWPPKPIVRNTTTTQEAFREEIKETQVFSAVKERPQDISLDNQIYSFTLISATNTSAYVLVNNTRFTLPFNESIRRFNHTWVLEEVALKAVAVPRKSWADLTINFGGQSTRTNIAVGEKIKIGNETLLLEFVGRDENGERAFVSVDKENVFLAEDEDHYFKRGYVRANHLYYNDPTEIDYVAGITVRIE